MEERFDAVVVGSGFGGSVTALRLAEAGLSVAVLERGRWWAPEDFPRRALDLPKIARTPLTPDGLYDVRWFDGVTTYSGNGVGGGSLVYSNVLYAPPDAVLDALPPGLRARDLAPRIARVREMLGAGPAPESPALPKTAQLRALAARLGEGRFRPVDLAVNFSGPRPVADADGTPHAGRISEACVGCGNCNLGCHVLAKRTLDITYLPAAIRRGARVFARSEVSRIEALPGSPGYRVHFHDRARRERRTFIGRRVVLAAGAVASTEILLRARAAGDLPRLSRALGTRFSVNGDYLGTAHGAREPSEGRRGPIITAAIEVPDAAGRGRDLVIEDGGEPPLLTGVLLRTIPQALEKLGAAYGRGGLRAALGAALRGVFPAAIDERTVTLLLMMRDAADGRATLDAGGRMTIRWRWQASGEQVARANDVIARLGRASGARVLPAPIPLDGRAHTVHPLGGCPLGERPASAVVSPEGEVFGHEGLYVADGAIVPGAVGVNPSLTIAALAESIAEGIAARG